MPFMTRHQPAERRGSGSIAGAGGFLFLLVTLGLCVDTAAGQPVVDAVACGIRETIEERIRVAGGASGQALVDAVWTALGTLLVWTVVVLLFPRRRLVLAMQVTAVGFLGVIAAPVVGVIMGARATDDGVGVFLYGVVFLAVAVYVYGGFLVGVWLPTLIAQLMKPPRK